MTRSSQKQEHQKAKTDEGPQDQRISPSFRPNLAHQSIHTGNLARCADNASIDTGERLTLETEILMNGIRLAEHTVYHIMTAVDVPSFFKHVVRLCLRRVRSPIRIDVGANI